MVDVLNVVGHLQHVVDDVAIDGLLEQMLRLDNHVVATLDSFAVGIADKLIHKALFAEELLEGGRIVELAELFAIVVGVFEAELGDGAFGHTLGVVGCKGCGVLGHKVVGHNAASAIDHSANGGVVFSPCLVDAVLTEKFATLIASDEVHFVFLWLAFYIGLLDAATRRGVVAGYGEMDERTVGELDGLLYQAFAEGATAHDDAPVIVLDGTREDFGGRCSGFVDKDDEWKGLVGTASVAAVFLTARSAALSIDDEAILGKKLIHHLDGSGEVAAAVATQIDHKALESFHFEFGQRGEQLGVGGFAEVLDFDVTKFFVNHVGGIDALEGNVASDNGEVEGLGLPMAQHSYFHFGAFLTFQSVEGLFIGDNLAHVGFAIHGHNLVSCQNAHFLRRSPFDDASDSHSVFADDKLDAYSAKGTFQVIVGGLSVFGRNVGGVGVEFFQNLGHGLFHDVGNIDGIDVLVIDDVEQVVQFVGRSVDDVEPVAGKSVGKKGADDDANDDADGDDEGHPSVVTVDIVAHDAVNGYMMVVGLYCSESSGVWTGSSGLMYSTLMLARLSRLMPSSRR